MLEDLSNIFYSKLKEE
jgi:hypothetical protein